MSSSPRSSPTLWRLPTLPRATNSVVLAAKCCGRVGSGRNGKADMVVWPKNSSNLSQGGIPVHHGDLFWGDLRDGKRYLPHEAAGGECRLGGGGVSGCAWVAEVADRCPTFALPVHLNSAKTLKLLIVPRNSKPVTHPTRSYSFQLLAHSSRSWCREKCRPPL